MLPGESTARILIDNIAYSATGELTGFDYGNGVHYGLSHDDHYRLEQLTAQLGQTPPLYGLDYAFDNSDNITHITDQLQGGNSQSFTYD